MAPEVDIAVVVPAYNAAGYLRRALDSVLAQSRPPVEIVVVDDGSQDGTAELVEREYAGRVRVLRQANRGPSAARNVGIAAVSATFVAFLDADDWWAAEKLERQAAVLAARPELLAVYTALQVHHDPPETPTWVSPACPEEELPRELMLRNPGMPPSCVVVRRSAVLEAGGFQERHAGCEDWALWIELARRGRLAGVAEPLTHYRLSPEGLSGDADRMFADFLRLLDSGLLRGSRGMRRWVRRRRAISTQAHGAAMTARAAGDWAKEWSFVALSLRSWPSPVFEPRRFRTAAVVLLRAWRRRAGALSSSRAEAEATAADASGSRARRLG